MNTTKGNELIAEFMGLKPQSQMDERYHGVPDIVYKYDGVDYRITNTATPENMLYHKSWDWLMEVIKKINSYTNEQMCFSDFDDYRNNWRMIDNPSKYHIKDVYEQVVDFLKGYNKKQKS